MSGLFAVQSRGVFWGLWHRSVYHTVNVIKSKSCQYLLAKGGQPLSAPQTALHLSDWIVVPGSTRHDMGTGGGSPGRGPPPTQPHAVFNTI